MSANEINNAIAELKWIYWIFPGVFSAGILAEIILNQFGDVPPFSDILLTVFWAVFAYIAQTLVLKRAIHVLKRQASTDS